MKLKYGTIGVKNMEESIKFYQDTFGFTIVNSLDLPDRKITFLKSDSDAGVELIEEESAPLGLYALAIEVDDVEKTAEDLKAKNPDLEIEVVKVSNNTLAFVKDPNGVTFALSG